MPVLSEDHALQPWATTCTKPVTSDFELEHLENLDILYVLEFEVRGLGDAHHPVYIYTTSFTVMLMNNKQAENDVVMCILYLQRESIQST